MTKLSEPLALEELKILEDTILKHDDIRSQIIGWCVALITGLSVAYLSKPVNLARSSFVFLGLTVVALFFWLDVIHKVAQNRAIGRAKEVESQIRDEKPYDGPLIAASFAKPNSFAAQRAAANNVRLWAPYTALLIIVLLVASGRF